MKTVKKLSLLIAAVCLMSTAVFAAGDRIFITSGEYYDGATNSFLYIVSELQNTEIYSNVPSGMVTTDRVSISADTLVSIELYRDGTVVENADLSNITEPGSYTLNLQNNGISYQPLSFTIVSELTGALDEYAMPTGFFVTSVKRDGVPQNFDTRGVSFAEEGEYEVGYACTLTGRTYQLNVTIDHTPPTLALANVNEKGIAKGPVDISDVEEDANMYILHNGKEATANGGILNESGDYRIIITDAAGNTAEFVFRIGVYFNVSTIISFVLLAAVIGALCTYLLRERKKMRVR